MKFVLHTLAALLCVSLLPAHAGEKPDLSLPIKEWKVNFPKSAEWKTEIVRDTEDGASALRIEVGKAPVEAWEGGMSQLLHLPPGNYVFSFTARAEPDVQSVELTAWEAKENGQVAGRREKRERVQVDQHPQDFAYYFTVTEDSGNITKLTVGNLARSEVTFWFSNFRVVRE